ncbi:uncharacterized protein LOC123211440 isoform X2 [Mangifera indica]|uniref:uncharacterized protein LOC123211440 isoform X2 n=1 Tax=Mangifera indica TaxID=29780 RepID=UPI001CFA7C1A|nr:uncharacterized protein LOC123211440 isoform X2 [Mangifera indica]
MDDAKKRWSVTFTKHIKQKRKVYQDGFLDLHISTNKVKLYDDCENLLECRILNNDEVVQSGETLTFNAYFVDVGDPEGDCKHIPDLNYQGRYKKKSQSGTSRSPSHKIIKEFKKRELQKYGTPKSNYENSKPRSTEWQVLYTTQLTQKAKKYHDGFLQLATSGSMGRQIILFDETRRLLDSRFLRKDEVIRSGESTAFDGHLVEIGECEENGESLKDLNVQAKNGSVAWKSEMMPRQQNCIKSNGKEFKKIEGPGCGAPQGSTDSNSDITEWKVMYTTQVTQKAKKYHDGFLRLAIIGSLQRQVMLYDESRKLLNSRFLKKDENISSGETIAFNAYLVDIGDPKEDHQSQMDLIGQGNNGNMVGRTMITHEQQNCFEADKFVKKGKLQNDSSRENAGSAFSISSVDGIKWSKSVPTNKPLRNAIQILTILQRPKTPGSGDAGSTGNSLMGQSSSTKTVEVSDAVISAPDDSELLVPQDESYENLNKSRSEEDMNIGNCPDLMSSKATSTSTSSGSLISKDSYVGNIDQAPLGVEICVSHGPGDGERNSFEEPKGESETKINGFPSFDLGF